MSDKDPVPPLLIVDKVLSTVHISPVTADRALEHQILPDPGPAGDVVLVDSRGVLFDVKRIAVIEPAPGSRGSGFRAKFTRPTFESYDYDVVEIGRIAWPDVLELICTELGRDFGNGIFDYPDDLEAEAADMKAEVRACADLAAVGEALGWGDMTLSSRVGPSRLEVANVKLMKAKLWVALTFIISVITFVSWIINISNWQNALIFMSFTACLAFSIVLFHWQFQSMPVNNRRVAVVAD